MQPSKPYLIHLNPAFLLRILLEDGGRKLSRHIWWLDTSQELDVLLDIFGGKKQAAFKCT
jgi:hypothetical protein